MRENQMVAYEEFLRTEIEEQEEFIKEYASNAQLATAKRVLEVYQECLNKLPCTKLSS